MAIIMKIEPMPEIKVRVSPRKTVEIATATIISTKSKTVEVTGEMFLNPFNQK